MILGKEEIFGTRPLLYQQRSSFFSVKDLEVDVENELIANTDQSLSRKICDLPSGSPHYVAPTSSSLARGKSVNSASGLSSRDAHSSRVINQQIHLNQLRIKQKEQLRPFFLAKSKFLVKENKEPKKLNKPKVT